MAVIKEMRHLTIVILFIKTLTCFGQTEEIQTEIKSENAFDLSIIKVYPDSFPNVSVVFQAKNKFGKPLWTLDKSEIQVTENHKDCDVIQLLNISKDKPINIGLVFDHSGSMVDNPAQMPQDLETMQDYYFSGLPMPEDYVMAIDYAKEGVLGFLDETKPSNDSISFVGFSTTVDKIYPLTNDVSGIKLFVEEVSPNGRTSFYDALFLTIENLSKGSSKSVIVALTDGQDNESTHTSQEVIDFANDKEIAIYTIGLGNVNSTLLEQVSQKTDGLYYYTNDPKKLKDIYLNIKEQIKSIYQVDYTSNTLDYLEEERLIQFSFVNDTLEFSENSSIYSLPEEVISYLKEKEEERISSKRNRFIFGGLTILLLGLGSFIVYKRKKEELIIAKTYPNPFENELTIKYNSPKNSTNTALKIIDMNGNLVFHKTQINSNGIERLNLESLENGMYIIQIFNDDNMSETVKVAKN
ncbi:T9SS type A sorting domain-containing protein [Mangrovimonas sp. TPBH4]|uniref:vWA domain-containing protein n=1 Tax=Mangrovimonas sp. TPBH4 TaxID=1645914 RepID=UPI0012FA0F6B|nr:T9SS type A sorting domain-containing protein [Mangrovimonas sp. TPBH4]